MSDPTTATDLHNAAVNTPKARKAFIPLEYGSFHPD